MNLYRVFIAAFVVSIIALIVVMFSYIQGLMHLMTEADWKNDEQVARDFFYTFFTPGFLIAVLVMGLSSLTYRVIGIVCAARNHTIESGEKAMWIVGFVIMGFITAIVFLVLARSKNMLTDPEKQPGFPGKYPSSL